MGKDSRISWTNHTFSPWHGCTKVGGSPACDHCYAESFSRRIGYSETGSQFPIWGDDAKRRYFKDKHFLEPLKWDKSAKERGVTELVFCASMADWAEGRPEQVPHLKKLWDLVLQTGNLNWLMLTKRPQLISKLCPFENHPRVWQGITTETQPWLNLRWEHLRRVNSNIYWLSIEPMLGRLTLPKEFLALGNRGWVICGGESGAHARHMEPDDARHLRDQCLTAGVRFHMKQMSGSTKAALEAIPEDLMIREYPEPQS